jgi:uncharacterized protein YdaU (DUF1376 family)
MNYYPFHIGDYASATRHLSWDEDAAYRRLLDVYYKTETPLPLAVSQVCRLVLATTDTQREAVQIVLEEFFVKTDAGWVNSRADEEIDAARAKQQQQREKANKRWHKPDAEPGIASAMPQHVETDATASKSDAVAMPPIPIPIPIPTPIPVPKNTARGALAPDGVPDPVWQDFLKVRKAKHLPMTDTAWQGITREAAKAGIDLAQAVTVCCERGWATFNAGWYAGSAKQHATGQRQGPNKQEALEARNRALAEEMIAEFNQKNGAEIEAI